LWKLLIDRNMKRTDLLSAAGISTNTLAKLGKNETVSVDSLEKICIALECNIEDILEIGGRYSNESANKSNGVVYTPRDLAEFVSASMAKQSDIAPGRRCTILDPAIGGGELIISLLTALQSKGISDFDVSGFEIDADVAAAVESRIREAFPKAAVRVYNKDFLDFVLNDDHNNVEFDFIIANPPYVRTQILGTSKSQKLAKDFGFNGRVDIYYAFLVASGRLLSENGVAGFITSNKFMTIRAGKSVREYLLKNVDMRDITDFGDTKLFSASVLPCTIIFKKGSTAPDNVVFRSIYEAPDGAVQQTSGGLFDCINRQGVFSASSGRKYDVRIGTLSASFDGSPWTINTSQTASWLSKVEIATKMRFKDIGKIRVGIKTTADNVFIGDDWSEDHPIELLRPLITHRDSGQIVSGSQNSWKVLYPHIVENGRRVCVDLDKYPGSRNYLHLHRPQLESREYLKKANRKWYEIWVPQNPDSWGNRKIVFRDISEKPQFWLDESGAIVNGDCYWMDIKDGTDEDVLFLALAVANSTFIEKYYDTKFNNKIYSGKRRYMSQYVEQFPIPDPELPQSKKAISLVRSIISSGGVGSSDRRKDLDNTISEIFLG
jgi:DNA-binding Xre family transcriptional regulator/methylase of polypeptide subunit release factors